MSKLNNLNIDNTYLKLDKKMYAEIEKTGFENPSIVYLNNDLANMLNIDLELLRAQKGIDFLSGNSKHPKYAQAYAGHQYEHFTMLGDGRALMIGEHVNKKNERVDLHLKGSGKTPFSRSGDGKATLITMLREYLISEAMFQLGVPTSRSLAILKTGEKVRREQLNDGAILVRTAKSHIRVGTFQYVHALRDLSLLKEFTDYTINRHYWYIEDNPNKYQEFLKEVINNQAKLVSKWLSVGFVHGVMNTDNVLISGETIDYGPCAFIDEYNPMSVYSSIDSSGRYRYNNQPYITSWNMARFAETILQLLDEDATKAVEIANQELSKFETIFNTYWLQDMSKKLGILDPVDDDKTLIQELLNIMEKEHLDYTNTFKLLTQNRPLDISNSEFFTKWFKSYQYRIKDINPVTLMDIMKRNNPYIIPRNHLVQEALETASYSDDYTLYNELYNALKQPYNYDQNLSDNLTNKQDKTQEFVTYCGT